MTIRLSSIVIVRLPVVRTTTTISNTNSKEWTAFSISNLSICSDLLMRLTPEESLASTANVPQVTQAREDKELL
jgi:hypothetical protein